MPADVSSNVEMKRTPWRRANQRAVGEDIPAGKKTMRLIPEGCKIRFYPGEYDADAPEYKEGGLCYVKD